MSADARAREVAPQAPLADPAEVQLLVLALGEALTLTGDAVSEIQTRLRAIAGAYGYPHPRVGVFPTLLIVALDAGGVAGVRTIDSFRLARLDQASAVIRLADAMERAPRAPSEAMAELARILATEPRFGTAAQIVAHGVLTVGLGLVINPAPVDLWVYAALGSLVGALKAWARRRRSPPTPPRRPLRPPRAGRGGRARVGRNRHDGAGCYAAA